MIGNQFGIFTLMSCKEIFLSHKMLLWLFLNRRQTEIIKFTVF